MKRAAWAWIGLLAWLAVPCPAQDRGGAGAGAAASGVASGGGVSADGARSPADRGAAAGASRAESPAGELAVVGGYRFLREGDSNAWVIRNSPADAARLGCDYIYLPPDCQVDAGASASFPILRLPAGAGERASVWRVDGGRRVACRRIRLGGEGLFEPDEFGPDWGGWAQHLRDIQARQKRFGRGPEATFASMGRELVDYVQRHCGESNEGIAKGLYWLAPPITSAGTVHEYQVLLDGGRAGGEKIVRLSAKPPVRIVQAAPAAGAEVPQFDLFEAKILLEKDYFSHVPERAGGESYGLSEFDRFDAYDADRNGNRIRVDAVFRLGGERPITVPCFAMRERFDGPWVWKVRFAPPRPGAWEVGVRAVVWHTRPAAPGNFDGNSTVAGRGGWRCHYWGYDDAADEHPLMIALGPGNHHAERPWADVRDPPRLRFLCVADASRGRPLTVPPAGQGPFYLYREEANRAVPFYLFGMAKAWGTKTRAEANAIQDGMAAHGVNFNYHFMDEPGVTLLAHASASKASGGHEDWFPPSGGPVRRILNPGDANQSGWREHSWYDQGHADFLDAIVEGYRVRNLYHGLVLWPQGAMKTGYQMDCPPRFRREARDDINGLAWCSGGEQAFFGAAGEEPEWLWQKNLYRYIIARWGYSPALAMWGTVGETEGFGDSVVWWQNHPECESWHARVVDFFRRTDWRRRPLAGWAAYANDWPTDFQGVMHGQGGAHAYTNGEFGEWLSHGCFNGARRDANAETDFLAFNHYPRFYRDKDAAAESARCDGGTGKWLEEFLTRPKHFKVWHYGAARMYDWVANCEARLGPGKRYLITEYGFGDIDGRYEHSMRSYVHFVNWAAFANGHLGTPLKWWDYQMGLVFPEQEGRPDYSREYKPLRNLLEYLRSREAGFGLQDITSRLFRHDGNSTDHLQAFGIGTGRGKDARGLLLWVFHDLNYPNPWGATSARSYERPDEAAVRNFLATIPGLTPGATYEFRAFNTWKEANNIEAGEEHKPASPSGQRSWRVAADGKGVLRFRPGNLAVLPAGTEAQKALANKCWDGADVLYIIRRAD